MTNALKCLNVPERKKQKHCRAQNDTVTARKCRPTYNRGNELEMIKCLKIISKIRMTRNLLLEMTFFTEILKTG